MNILVDAAKAATGQAPTVDMAAVIARPDLHQVMGMDILTGAAKLAGGAAAAGLNGIHAAKNVVAANLPTDGMAMVSEAASKGSEWIAANHPCTGPAAIAACVAAGVGVGMVLAPGAVAAPLLGLAGFGAEGIAAGSMAAGVHSGIGSAVAPSLFATLQSAGMGGYGAATVASGVQAAGGVAAGLGAAGSGVVGWAKSKL